MKFVKLEKEKPRIETGQEVLKKIGVKQQIGGDLTCSST